MATEMKLKMTGKRYVVPFIVAAAALAAGGISALLYALVGLPGAAVGFALGGLVGHYGYRFAMRRWGGWEWVPRA